MLQSLSIENLAVIASQRVGFAPGLIALTGETGAGKSVVLAALGLALGARASAELVRTGAESATVEARFRPAEATRALLRRAELPGAEDEVLLVRRVVPARGAGRATVNGRVVPVGLLAELGRTLVDSAGQHDQHGLLDPDTHLDILDRAADLAGPRAEMAARWEALTQARREIDRLERAAREADDRAAWLRFQLCELDALDPRPGEEESLRAEQRLLSHAVELEQGLRLAEKLVYSGEGAAVERVGGAAMALSRLGAIDPSLSPLADQLREIGFLLDDVARTLRGRGRASADPGRQDAIESRLAELERIARKHRCPVADLPLRRGAVQAELDEILHLEDAMDRARLALEAARRQALAVAEALSARRIRAAEALEASVVAALRELAMPQARLEVALLPNAEGEVLDGRLLGPLGLERAELRLSANPGEDLRPLHRVASGGELSRVLLALKLALREGGAGATPTLVFDEVDSGLGGLAADDVGRRLRALSGDAQVICVTHLPQIAAMADAQLAVRKRVEGGRTSAEVRALGQGERPDEVARMLGGPEARPYAEKLLEGAALDARGPRRRRGALPPELRAR